MKRKRFTKKPIIGMLKESEADQDGSEADNALAVKLDRSDEAANFGLSSPGPGNHRPDGPMASHALKVKLDHSAGADQAYLSVTPVHSV